MGHFMTELITQPIASVQTLMRPIASPKEMIGYHDDITKMIQEALKSGTDYGIIPGTGNKPVLFKAGAERINLAFGTHPEYDLVEKEVDHDRENEYEYFDKYKRQKIKSKSTGLYRYVYKCRITKIDGKVVAEGEGVCSSLESKFISRPRDNENTISKMAQKRAFLAATLHAFGLSDRFTQDVEDFVRPVEEEQAPVISKLSPKIFNKNNPQQYAKLDEWLIKEGLDPDQVSFAIDALEGKDLNEHLVPLIKRLKEQK